ncbi:MAG: UDP-N-acetylmuramoyl-L-alanine--D-glutamate ligase [Bacteroidales bacterium]|nr:UDP-N-acetylmuramoyl-L-alanine--D-glutamate ligase [Bacteroidales bacterium]
MKDLLKKLIEGKRVLILGFGREGKSSYRLLRKFFPEIRLIIADKNADLNLSELDGHELNQILLGEKYLEALNDADLVFKSPGIDFNNNIASFGHCEIVSQTSLFLERFHRQIIGVTGTKGKSTTSSLIFHLLKESGRDAVLVGNIGIPPFDAIERITDQTRIVFEISAHQLEFVNQSPHIAVLLNIFQEHLDYFKSVNNYAHAKFNIAVYQNPSDYLIYDASNEYLKHHIKAFNFQGQLIPVDLTGDFYNHEKEVLFIPETSEPVNIALSLLRGQHNIKNILVSVIACHIAGLHPVEIEKGIATFRPLEHRLEFAGVAAGITFINDSISTIPEATIEAVKTLPETDTIILGGKDRGIDYSELIVFLANSGIRNFLFTGPAGKRMMEMLEQQINPGKNLVFVYDWNDLPSLILNYTLKGKACLLSPAASSYDRFENFEERGKLFKKIVKNLASLK